MWYNKAVMCLHLNHTTYMQEGANLLLRLEFCTINSLAGIGRSYKNQEDFSGVICTFEVGSPYKG
jgi:hypothetical protein